MKTIWFEQSITLEQISVFNKKTIMEALDIQYTEIGPDYIIGTLPVSHKTVQPHQKLHGGASCVLAETLGSVASNLIVDQSKAFAVGQHISTQHLRPGNMGELVTGKAVPVHLGSKTHLWNIDIVNPEGKLVSTTRLTMAIINR
jgi:1,4-dihydroxy-2-naphthoyl-CoA hydrolase